MRTTSLLRSAALALGLALALPAPASPQLGKWVKKAIKQKIADKVEQTVLGSDSTSATPSAAGSSAAAPSGGRTGASRITTAAPAPAGPRFTEYLLEITPEVLAKVEKGVAAEAADRKLAGQELAKILSRDDHEKCQIQVSRTPEGQKAYREFTAQLQGNDQQAMAQASQTYAKRLDDLSRPKCGPGGTEAEDLRRDLRWRPEKTGLAASGLTEYQYNILKERIVPFCSLPQPPAPAATGETRVPAGTGYSGSLDYVYAPGETAALQPRCARLMAGLAPEQPSATQSAAAQPAVAKKPRPGKGT